MIALRCLYSYLQVEFELALDDFSEAIALDSSVANFYYNRGLIEFRLKVTFPPLEMGRGKVGWVLHR